MKGSETSQKALLQRFVAVRDQMRHPEINATIKGELTLDAGAIAHLKALADEKCAEFFIALSGPDERIAISELGEAHQGRTAKATLIPTGLAREGLRYFDSLDTLILAHNYEAPKGAYYIYSLRFHSSDAERPAAVSHYLDTIAFIQLLREISDFDRQEGNLREIFFFDDSKLNILTGYSAGALRPLNRLDELKRHFTEPADKEERRIIFRSVLYELCHGISLKDRFRVLLDNFPTALENYFQSIELYLKGFNITKMKSEFQEKKLKFLHEIYEAVSGIHSQLISIPLAVFLLAYSFDISGQDLFKNIALLAASFAFSFLFDILLQSQQEKLESLALEIGRFKKDAAVLLASEKKEAAGADRQGAPLPPSDEQSYFERSFRELEDKKEQRFRQLNLLGAVSWSVCLVIALLFLVFQLLVPVCSLYKGIFAFF